MLDLEPTADTTAIRRAYHAQLRKIDPDNDPASFIALRQAFEEALKGTPPNEYDANDDDDDDFDDHSERTRQDEAWESDARAEDRKLTAAFLQAARDNRAVEAEPLFNAIMAKGIVDLGAEAFFVGQFLGAAREDLRFPAARLEDWTNRLLTAEFVGIDERLRSLRETIGERLVAEKWYASLQDQARGGWLWSWRKRQERRVARLLLKKRWQGMFLRVNGTALDRALVQYRVHKGWMGARLDGDWMARIERKRKRQLRRGMIFLWMFAAFIVCDIIYVIGRGLITGEWN